METRARVRLDLSVRSYPVQTRRKLYSVLGLAAAILVTGFAPWAAAQQPGAVGYVANSADGTVSLLLATQDQLVTALNGSAPQTVKTGTAPVRVAVAPAAALVFVTNQGANSITVIDCKTNTALPTAILIQPVGSGAAPSPQGIAVLESQAGIILYVANPGDNSVSVINATNIKAGTFTELARITQGVGPTPIEVALQAGNAYVLNNNQGGAGSVSVISTAGNTLVGQPIPVGTNASAIAASPDGGVLYVTNRGDNSVTVLDVAAPLQIQIAGVPDPVGVAFDPNPAEQNAKRVAYVTNFSTGTVTEITDEAICNNKQNGQCFGPNPLPLPPGTHPSQIQVVDMDTVSQVFISDPVGATVLSFVPFDDPQPTTLIAGNAASGLAFIQFADSTNPNPPVCGLTQTLALDTGDDQVTGVCLGGGAAVGVNPSLSFQVAQKSDAFFCGDGATCNGNGGFVGGVQNYNDVAAGVYTVIICSVPTEAPPSCGGTAAQQLVVWPGKGNAAPTVTCPQFTATPDATLGLTADASGSCDDSMFTLTNETTPKVDLSLVVRVNWGDGSIPALQTGTQATGNKITGTHQYAKAGTYPVTLSASDTTLLTAAPQTIQVTVKDAPPTCTFPVPSVSGYMVTAAPTCFDEFNKPVDTITINWGPNVPGSPTVVPTAKVNQPVMFTYPTKPAQTTYMISVFGTSGTLSSAAVTQNAAVPDMAPQPPTCTISASAILLAAQAPVTCNSTTEDNIASVLVTWGDGTNSTATPETATYSNTFQHNYPSVPQKTYTITVVATATTGLSSTPATTTLQITPPAPPQCSLVAQPTGGLSVSATAHCTSSDTTLASVSLNFGDGTIVPGTVSGAEFGPQTFAHTYAVAGTFTITLTATDSLELTTSKSGSVSVPSVAALGVSGPSNPAIAAGGSVTYTITVGGVSNTNPPLTLSCAADPPQNTLPEGLVCLFQPATVMPGGTSVLTIATNSLPLTTGALRMPSLYSLGLALLPAILLVGSAGRRRKSGACTWVLLCLAMALVLLLAACGSDRPTAPAASTTPAGTYNVVIRVKDAINNVLGSNVVTLTVK